MNPGPRFLAAPGLLFCLALQGGAAQAAEIYRWVDESGRIQFSDTVPDKYKKSATKTDTRQFEVSGEQKLEAEERARRDAERLKALEQGRARPPAKEAAAGPAAAKPVAAAADSCEQQHRRYRESLDCFAPFVQANGTTRAEAYKKCTVVKDPSPECGPPRSRESTSRSSR